MPAYSLPELPYSYGALEPHYSAQVLELHHDKHHAAYVKGANETLQQLAEARESNDFSAINMLTRSMAFHLSGHVLHSIFWTNMSPDGGDRPEGELGAAVDEFFGGFDRLQGQHTAATVNVQGIGCGAHAWEPVAERLVVEQIHDHQGNVGAGTVPLLVIDSWEHAYYLQYKNVKADYVKAFWNIVNWPDVHRRFDEARTVPATA